MFFVLSIVLISTAIAHTGKIQGYVRDGDSGEYLVGASVQLDGTRFGAVSDIFGRFYINDVPEGSYVAIVSFVGFVTYRDTVVVEPDKTSSVAVTLSPGALRLSDIVVSAKAIDHELTTISSVDLSLRPVNTSQDVLRLVPGLFIAQHAGGGKAEQIFLRGFDIDHGTDINLSVDGIPVNMVSHAHGQGYSDLHFIIPETIDRVDFNKGPYYADKGDFATAGYASFNTFESIDQSLIKVEGGQYGTVRAVGIFDLVNKESDESRENWYLASEYFLTGGYFESPQNFNRLNLFTKYSRRVGNTSRLSASLSTFSSRWDASGQIPERAVRSGVITRFGAIDDTEGGETSRTNFNLQFQKALANEDLTTHQAFISLYDFYLVSNFTFFLDDPVNGDQITQRESRKIYGYQGSYLHSSTIGKMRLTSELGGGFRYDDINDLRLSRTKDRKVVLSDLAFGQVDQTNLQAALRYDHLFFNYDDKLAPQYDRKSNSKGIISPKMSLNYTMNSTTVLYAKAGYGFHSNDSRVVVARQGKKILPAARGFDIGFIWKPSRHIVAQGALWMLDMEQEFVYVGDAGIVEAGDPTRRKGIDFSLRYQLTNTLFLDTDVTFAEARTKGVSSGEDHVPLAPSFSSIGGITYRSSSGLNASLRYRFLDDRPANETRSLIAEGYAILDAMIRYSWRNFEVSVSCENVLDEEWNEAQFETESRLKNEDTPVSEIHFTPGTPLFFKAGLSVRF
jgi:hypothetical protein